MWLRFSTFHDLLRQYIRMPEGIITILGTLGILLFFGSLTWMLILKLRHKTLLREPKFIFFSSLEISALCNIVSDLIGTGYLTTLSRFEIIENISGDVITSLLMLIAPLLILKLRNKIIKVALFILDFYFLLNAWFATIVIIGSTIFVLIFG